MNSYDLVRARLKKGEYKFPDRQWVQEYNAWNGTTAPLAGYWWAICQVAEFYDVEGPVSIAGAKTFKPHYDEAIELWRAFVEAKCVGTTPRD